METSDQCGVIMVILMWGFRHLIITLTPAIEFYGEKEFPLRPIENPDADTTDVIPEQQI